MNVDLREDQIKTLITIIEHSRNIALGSGSGHSIDTLCRKDCADRWWELRNYLASYLSGNKAAAK